MQCRPSSTVNDGHIHPHIIHWLVSLWWHELGIIAVVFSVFQTRRWWANIWQQTPDILDNPPSITQRINFMFYLVLPETSNQPMNSSLSVHWGYRVRISGLFFSSCSLYIHKSHPLLVSSCMDLTIFYNLLELEGWNNKVCNSFRVFTFFELSLNI